MNQTRRLIGGLAFPALLLTLLLLFVGPSVSQPLTENESDIAVLPPDADNVELHHIKVIDGVMHEDQPVVMYKEDFVTEDYDPSKNETKVNHHKKHRHLQRIRHHHSRPVVAVEKNQERMSFDLLSETPIASSDDDSAVIDDFQAVSLLEPTKEESLQKYPKKYHNRQRRQAYNPYIRHGHQNDYHVYYRPAPAPYYLPSQPQHYNRYPVAGKEPKYRGKLPYWKTKPSRKPSSEDMFIGNRDNFADNDDNSIFHNSNPDDADFSMFDQPRPDRNQAGSIGGGSGSSSSSSSNSNNWQSPPLEEPEERPVWGPSSGRRPNENVAQGGGGFAASAPASQRPPQPVYSSPGSWARPVFRQDSLLYPEEPTYQVGSACHRATHLCCNLRNLASLYDCFQHQNCDQSLSAVLSACS